MAKGLSTMQISLSLILFVCMMTAEISGFFLPQLKNPLASKNKVNTGLEAPWRHSYYAPPSQTAPLDSLESQESLDDSSEETSGESEEGSGSKETKESKEESSNESEDSNEESDEYSLYSDIAEQEYDYEEEDYEGIEDDDSMPRNLPTDPIGLAGRFISDIGRRLEIEIDILSRNIRIGLALLTFTG